MVERYFGRRTFEMDSGIVDQAGDGPTVVDDAAKRGFQCLGSRDVGFEADAPLADVRGRFRTLWQSARARQTEDLPPLLRQRQRDRSADPAARACHNNRPLAHRVPLMAFP